MILEDSLGLALSGQSPEAVVHLEKARHELSCFIGDPLASADMALAADPELVMAHVLKGYLFGLSTEREAIELTQECHEKAAALACNERERRHVAALAHLCQGFWREAGHILEELTIDFPLDSLALQAGHQIDFFTGNTRMLCDRIGRAATAWAPGMPFYHAVLGMQAFGLEEAGEYSRAEALGRKAVELEPRDGWAQHAVAHVMEMQCRQRDGIEWMRANPGAWSRDSFLKIHNWWHLALFHYELGETEAVLELFDGPIFGSGPALALNLVDASAILWRLHLGGAKTGDRWQRLAARWAGRARDANYAFNDIHAMMAFVGAGEEEAAQTLIQAQEEAMRGVNDNATFTSEVGYPVTLAIHAFGAEDYEKAVTLLRPIPPIAHRFGGSHAQRDVIDLTLLEAAFRAGDGPLARALSAERANRRPESPLSRYFLRRSRGDSGRSPRTQRPAN